jgi:hypothetical protein
MDEHIALLESVHNASPGSYVIHNAIILHLPNTEKEYLVMYNSIWTKHSVLSVWKRITVMNVAGGSTAFFRVPFHPNSYELIITRLYLCVFTAFLGILKLSCCKYSQKILCYSILAHDVSNCDCLLLRHVRSTTSVLVCRLYLAELLPLVRTTRFFVFI